MFGQLDYPTVKDIETNLKSLMNKHNKLAKLQKIATSPGNNPVYVISLGDEGAEFKPGIALVAGIDGRHPAGVYMAMKMAEQILDEHADVLNSNAIYIFPLVNPDAYAQMHASLKYERQGNGSDTDEDRDGRFNEDPYEDLNKDGFITHVRIVDPTGDQIAHKDDDRVLINLKKREADQTIYRLVSEGMDNDKDGKFNEDGSGGVHIYKNFPYDYPAFTNGAGDHAMSEVENRALADFLFDHWNIHTVISLGMENNLNDPEKYDKSKQSKRIKTGPFEKDGSINELIGEIYKKVPGTSNHVPMKSERGGFSSWAYFHYGRYSYSTPGWWAPVMEVKQDSTASSDDKKKKDGGKEMSYDQRYIKWADSMGIQNYFVPWTEVDHPDFPGMKAEVGGFKPFVRNNPPVQFLDSAAVHHVGFILKLTEHMPNIEFQGIKVDKIDNSTFRVTGKAVNTGLLPTHAEIGDRTRWVRKIRSRVILEKDQSLLLGNDKSFHNTLQPGESIDFNWLINGKGNIMLEVGSPMTGLKSYSIELK